MQTRLGYPNPTNRSGDGQAAPHCESGGTSPFVGGAVLKLALRRRVVEDQGMVRRDLLQPCPRASSEGQVRGLGSVGEPAPHLATLTAA